MEIKMVLFLPRDSLSVPVSRQVLDSCLETLGVTPDTRADIALALSEACANVIRHAGPGEEYEVQVSTKGRRCAIEVVNAGSRDGGSGLGGGTAAVRAGPAVLAAGVDDLDGTAAVPGAHLHLVLLAGAGVQDDVGAGLA